MPFYGFLLLAVQAALPTNGLFGSRGLALVVKGNINGESLLLALLLPMLPPLLLSTGVSMYPLDMCLKNPHLLLL